MRYTTIIALALLLTACGRSVDERFKAMCDEQIEIGFIKKDAEGVCTHSQYLSKADKEKLISMWDELRAQGELVDQLRKKARANGHDVD